MNPEPCARCDVLLRLAAVERRLAALDARLDRRVLSRQDRDALGKLLPAIAGAVGSEMFTVRELFDNDAPGVRLVLRGRSPRKVGRLFGRGAGRDVAGYVIERVAVERHAVLWRIGSRATRASS